MTRRGGPSGLEIFQAVVLTFGVLLLFLAVLQMDNIEALLIKSNQKLVELDDKARLQELGLRKLNKSFQKGLVAVGPNQMAAGNEVEKRKWLHPEVENYVKPDPFKLVADEAKPGGTITRWWASDPKGLNYLLNNASDVNEGMKTYCMESLCDTHFKNPDIYSPKLAIRVEVTNDYKEYTFYLRKGIKWHKPAVDLTNPRYAWLKGDHEFTAHDVKFTVDLIKNTQVEAAHLRNYYEDLEECKVIDDYTVVLKWSKKTYNSIAFSMGVYPLPEFLYAYDEDGERFPEETMGLRFNEHWYNNKAIGTGPYQFVRWEQGVTIELTRNDEYWGETQPIKNIKWLIFNDRKTNLLKLKSKEMDYARLYPPDYREEIKKGVATSPFKDGRIKHSFFTQAGYYYIGWNMAKEPFTDVRVRKAMTMCLDREKIINNILMGLGKPATGPFFCESPYSDPSIKPLPFDTGEAAKLLTEAGWIDSDGDGKRDKIVNGKKMDFEFTFLLYAGSPEWRALATMFKEELIKVGCNMNITEVEWSLMQKRMNDRDFDCYSGGWGASWDPDPFQLWHSSQADLAGSSNRIGFKVKEADEIIEKLRNTFDKKERIKLCHKFHKIIHDLQPYTFYYSRRRVLAWWDHLKRVVFAPTRPQDTSKPWYIDMTPE